MRVAGEVFEVPRERIALKTRRPQARAEKYARVAQRGEFMPGRRGRARLHVNLFDYLDTGLFLDHRPTRALRAELANGKRFLNLFCYTGAATVYAAAGGARIDDQRRPVRTYLEWAARNLENMAERHAGTGWSQADTLAWLEADTRTYDLIFVDPPTFSNSKRADDFDVQRDHVRLLRAAVARLAGRHAVFSNNFRRFKLDAAVAPFAVATRSAPRPYLRISLAILASTAVGGCSVCIIERQTRTDTRPA